MGDCQYLIVCGEWIPGETLGDTNRWLDNLHSFPITFHANHPSFVIHYFLILVPFWFFCFQFSLLIDIYLIRSVFWFITSSTIILFFNYYLVFKLQMGWIWSIEHYTHYHMFFSQTHIHVLKSLLCRLIVATVIHRIKSKERRVSISWPDALKIIRWHCVFQSRVSEKMKWNLMVKNTIQKPQNPFLSSAFSRQSLCSRCTEGYTEHTPEQPTHTVIIMINIIIIITVEQLFIFFESILHTNKKMKELKCNFNTKSLGS